MITDNSRTSFSPLPPRSVQTAQSSSMASPYPLRSVEPYSSSLLRPLLPTVRVVLGVPGVIVLDEKLLLVLGWERILCGRCGEGRVALEERIADAELAPEPVANGRTEGVSCESGSLDDVPEDILDVCARWAGYGCDCETVEDEDELGRNDDDDELGSACPVAWAMAALIPDRVNACLAHSRPVSVAETGPVAVPPAREASAYRSVNGTRKQTRLQLLPGSRSRYDRPSTGSTGRRSAATRRLES